MNCSLVVCIAECEDGPGDSISTEDASGIGVTRSGVTKSGVTEGTEIWDGVTMGVDCTDGAVRIWDVPKIKSVTVIDINSLTSTLG